MGASLGLGGKGRYDKASIGFVNHEIEYLTAGKRTLCEGQHLAGAGVHTLVARRTPSPVSMRIMTSRNLSLEKSAKKSHDSREFSPELAFRLTKPRPIAHKIPPPPFTKEAPPKPTADTASACPLQACTPTLSATPQAPVASPLARTGFALCVGRESPPFFDTSLGAHMGNVARRVQTSTSPAKCEGGAADEEDPGKGPPRVRDCDYKEQLLNINSVADYYNVVKLWEVASRKEGAEKGETMKAATAHPVREADALARAAAFAKVGWRDTAAGDKDERMRRRKAKGYDFSVTTGRSSPLYYFSDQERNDLNYSNEAGAAAAHPKEPLGTQSGREPPACASHPLDMHKIMKQYKAKQTKHDPHRKSITFHTAANPLTWTSPEYWDRSPQKGGPISPCDDFMLNPTTLTTNTMAMTKGPAPMGMYQGRDAFQVLGTTEKRNKIRNKLAMLEAS